MSIKTFHSCLSKSLTLFLVFTIALSLHTKPLLVFAEGAEVPTFEVAGWVPYWRLSEGIKDTRSHLSDLTEVYPFGYSVEKDGSLKDLADMKSAAWKRLIKAAKSKGVKIIPTVMWSDTQNMHKILSNPSSRASHIEAIISMLKKGKFDGVDIDYEGKLSDTKDYYSAFIIELKAKMGGKLLTCTIEPRTPPDSLYKITPTVLQYSNDYTVLGQYCDRFQIMAYDQGRADLKLNAANIGAPYAPIADIEWVRKVVSLALKSVPREKIILGIPTYGREFEVTVSPNWFQNYRQIRSVNRDTGINLAKEYHVTPSRNSGGEMGFTYMASTSPFVLPSSIQIPSNTSSGNTVAARALSYANLTGKTLTFNLISWSDKDAIKQKIDLAKEFGLKGIAIFKIDGKEDPDMWDFF